MYCYTKGLVKTGTSAHQYRGRARQYLRATKARHRETRISGDSISEGPEVGHPGPPRYQTGRGIGHERSHEDARIAQALSKSREGGHLGAFGKTTKPTVPLTRCTCHIEAGRQPQDNPSRIEPCRTRARSRK